jgi:NAD(P)-dependent dehydrogenase (short-subunit alcohol dehydrogenase family)
MARRSGRVTSVVITGVSSGIGLETAKLVIETGGRVFGSVRRDEDAERMQARLGKSFTPLLFDVRDDAAVEAEARRVRGLLDGRRLSGLVNNAAVALPGPLLYQPAEEIRAQIETDLIAPFMVTRAFAPLLGADPSLSGPPGRIVNISSIGGKLGQPFASGYIASKHGIEGFSEALRRELQMFGIEVAIVAPGVVATPIWDKVEPFLGRYADTPYGAAFDQGIRDMLKAGRDHGLPPCKVAETIVEALTTSRPKPRYGPAQHPILEQGLMMVLPRRVIDWAMARHLGLRRETRSKAD